MSLGKRWFFLPEKIAYDLDQKEGVAKIMHQNEWIEIIPEAPTTDLIRKKHQKYKKERVLFVGEAPYQKIKYEVSRIKGDDGDFIGDRTIWLETKPHPTKPEGCFYRKGCYEGKYEELLEKVYQKVINKPNKPDKPQPPPSPISSISSISSSANTTPISSPSCDNTNNSSTLAPKRKSSIFQNKNTLKNKKDKKMKEIQEQEGPVYDDPKIQTEIKFMADILTPFGDKDIESVAEALRCIGFFHEYKYIEPEKWNIVVTAYKDILKRISSKPSKSTEYENRFKNQSKNKKTNKYRNKNKKNDYNDYNSDDMNNSFSDDDKTTKCVQSDEKLQERYKCDECTKAFTKKLDLKIHKRVHIGSYRSYHNHKKKKHYDSDDSNDDSSSSDGDIFDHPDYCGICDKIIKQNKKTGDKSDKKKAYKPGNAARKHFAKKHQQNDTFKCPFCKLLFPNTFTLNQHTKTQHAKFFRKEHLLPVDIICKNSNKLQCKGRCKSGWVVNQYKICCIKCSHKRVPNGDVEEKMLKNNIYTDLEMLKIYPLYANCQKSSKEDVKQQMDVDQLNDTNLKLNSLSISPSPPPKQQQTQHQHHKQSQKKLSFNELIQCGLCHGYFTNDVYLKHVQSCFANKN